MRSQLHSRSIRRATSIALLLTVAASGIAVTTAASAVPSSRTAVSSTPGPFTSAPLYSEDFEHELGTRPVMLDDYVGATGQRYGADPYWLDAEQCNGIILSDSSDATPGCAQGAILGKLANALGQIGGTDPKTNHAISAWTSNVDQTSPGVQLQTVQPIRTPGANRFVSFGVNAVATSCQDAHPLLSFFLLDGTVEHRVGTPIDPCVSAGSADHSVDGVSIRGGSFASSGGVLLTGTDVSMLMRNEQLSSAGNDGAFDGMAVYDSTPTLRNSFADEQLLAGDSTRLTMTVTNTSELGAKAGWSFTEQLPAGLSLAADPDIRTDCANGAVTPTGPGAVAVVGDLEGGQASCAISVVVTSLTAGSFTVGAGSVQDVIGLDLPADATLAVAPEQNALTLVETATIVDGNADQFADGGESLHFQYLVSNAGNVAIGGLSVASTVGTASCLVGELAPGASTTCTAGPILVTQTDIDAGGVSDRSTASGTSRLGAPVSSAEAGVDVPTTPSAAGVSLTIAATVHPAVSGSERGAVGDTFTLAATVRNAGNVSLADIDIDLAERPEFSVVCPTGTVAPGASIACTISGTHRFDQGDVDAGGITFSATATGRTPDGQRVVSPLATATAEVVEPRAQLTVIAGSQLSTAKLPKPGDAVVLTLAVRNSGNVTAHDVRPALPNHPSLRASCPEKPLAPGKSMTCTVSSAPIVQSAIEVGRMDVQVDATALSPTDAPVTASADTGVALRGLAELSLDSVGTNTADRGFFAGAEVGDRISSRYTVVNRGNLTVSSIDLTSDRAGAISCPRTQLRPGETLSCAASKHHTISKSEASRGSISFTAESHGLVRRANGLSTPPSVEDPAANPAATADPIGTDTDNAASKGTPQDAPTSTVAVQSAPSSFAISTHITLAQTGASIGGGAVMLVMATLLFGIALLIAARRRQANEDEG